MVTAIGKLTVRLYVWELQRNKLTDPNYPSDRYRQLHDDFKAACVKRMAVAKLADGDLHYRDIPRSDHQHPSGLNAAPITA